MLYFTSVNFTLYCCCPANHHKDTKIRSQKNEKTNEKNTKYDIVDIGPYPCPLLPPVGQFECTLLCKTVLPLSSHVANLTPFMNRIATAPEEKQATAMGTMRRRVDPV